MRSLCDRSVLSLRLQRCHPRKTRPCRLSFAAKVSPAEITKDLPPAEASRAWNTTKGHVGTTSP